MIPILYESTETAFISNGLGRLRDMVSCVISEERNNIFECQFEYPVTGAHFEDITIGRIIAVTHDDTGDVQPFDIVSYSRPIDGVVTFQAVHVSYRLTQMTATGANINSLADALTMLGTAEPANPFTFTADFTSNAFMASADGIPRTVKQFLGGIEGSILDTYGGEYEWDRFNVILHKARGVVRDWSIRYGVNLIDSTDEVDSMGTFTSCIPFWSGTDTDGSTLVVKGNKVDSGLVSVDGRDRCVPLDLTDKFETQPTTAQLESEALSQMQAKQVNIPAQNIKVEFARLQDFPEYAGMGQLLACSLCDTLTVQLPGGQSGQFKIVKTEWDALKDTYLSMELGTLSTTLSEALGITQALDKMSDGIVMPDDYVTDIGTDSPWTYRKWNSGRIEAWRTGTVSVGSNTASGQLYRGDFTASIPAGIFTATPGFCIANIRDTTSTVVSVQCSATSTTRISGRAYRTGSSSGYNLAVGIYVAQF
jgi:phage minor structural protein